MSAFSNYSEAAYVDHFLRNNAVGSPTSVFLALFESNPNEDASGTETSYVGYARQQAQWTALDANGQTRNTAAISFAANGNASASVTITHAAVFDSATAGNMLLHGPLASPKTLAVGDVLAFGINAMVLTLD